MSLIFRNPWFLRKVLLFFGAEDLRLSASKKKTNTLQNTSRIGC